MYLVTGPALNSEESLTLILLEQTVQKLMISAYINYFIKIIITYSLLQAFVNSQNNLANYVKVWSPPL